MFSIELSLILRLLSVMSRFELKQKECKQCWRRSVKTIDFTGLMVI